jgi:hypothetical protein
MEAKQARRARIDTYNVYSRLLGHAMFASDAIAASWKRPKRHNKAIEQDALFCSLMLDADCRRSLADGTTMPSTSVASLEARYEVHGAIQTVHAVLPFTLAERDVLLPPGTWLAPAFGDDESTVPNTGLIERWHEWLWMDELGQPQTSTEALGASALLQEGCRRLCASLPEVMEKIGLPPL